MRITLAELATRLEGRVQGDPDYEICRIASLSAADHTAITFFSAGRSRSELEHTRAGVVLLGPDDAAGYPGNCVVVNDPYVAFAKAAQIVHTADAPPAGVHDTATVSAGARVPGNASIGPNTVIGEGAVVGDHARIGANCSIGAGAAIGNHCHLHDNVVIYARCVLGQRCTVLAGAVIGSDGFGYAEDRGVWLRIPQIGRVVVGDDVDIGANTTIDRGTLDDTVIGNRVKLDNHIQIAHNVRIGDDTIMAACAGVAGSTQIGARCRFGGRSSIAGHLTVVDDVHVAAVSLVTHSLLNPGMYSSALPVIDNRRWRRIAARIHRLNELVDRVRKLERRDKELFGGESNLDHRHS